MWKTMAVPMLSLAVLACSSSTGVPATSHQGGQPGQPITLEIVGGGTSDELDAGGGKRHSIRLEVTNVADYDVTVSRIIVDKDPFSDPKQIIVDSTVIDPNEQISPGESETFDVRLNTQLNRQRVQDLGGPEIRVVVQLLNGESYHYSFTVPLRP